MTKAHKPRVLNYGIDSWDIRVSRNLEPSQWLRDCTARLRKSREKLYANVEKWNANLEVIPGVGTFQALPKAKHYEFVLVNPEICDIRIWNPDQWLNAVAPKPVQGGKPCDGTGQLYFSIRSRLIQFNGPQAALDLVEKAVAFLTGEPMPLVASRPFRNEFTRTSRFDLFADVEASKPVTIEDVMKRFTCRARKRDFWLEPFSDALEQEFISKSKDETRNAEGLPLLNNKGGDLFMRNLRKRCERDRRFAFQVEEMLRDVLGVGIDAGLSRVVASGGRELQTAYFGRFASPLYARVYDKIASLPVQGKEYMRDVWRDAGWDEERPVWRFEFSMSGDFLRAAQSLMHGVPDLRDAKTTLMAAPGLWAYLTRTWLKHCKPSRDENASRWEESTLWKAVQGAFTQMTPIVRIQPEPCPDEGQLMAQAKGVVTSIGAMLSSPRYQRGLDLETGEVFDAKAEIIKRLFEYLHSDEGQEKLEDRISRFGLDEHSDTVFSATVRSEQLLEGRGS